jgi:hypothetical protein
MSRDKDVLSFKITKARSSAGVDTAYRLDWIPAYQYMAFAGKQKAEPQSPGKKGKANDKPRYGISN